MKTVLKFALLALGLWVLWSTIRSVGIVPILKQVSALGWKMLPFFAVWAVIYAFHTVGWSYSYPKPLPRTLPFGLLYAVRISGETLNAIIPWAASLGGEPFKADVLKRRHGVGLIDSYASCLIVHTTYGISLLLFTAAAVALNWNSASLSPDLWKNIAAFLGVVIVGSAALVWALSAGLFRFAHGLGDRLGIWKETSAEKKERFEGLDEEIRLFYSEDPARFALSVVFNLLGWLGGVVEVYLLAQWLGMPVDFRQAWLLEALIQAVRTVTFFIPASVGTQEAGIIYIFSELGFTAASGGAFAVARRLRELFWIAVGLLLWAKLDSTRLKSV